MSLPRVVVVLGPQHESRYANSRADAVLASFSERVDLYLDPEWSQEERERRFDEAIAGADGLIIAGWANEGIGFLSSQRLARAPKLRFIGSSCHHRQGEFIDLDAARGIALCETNVMMSHWVAEYELGLVLAGLRRIPQEHGLVERGEWITGLSGDHERLHGKRVGLVGFGEIHRQLVRYLTPFETDWWAYDPLVDASRIQAAGGRKAQDLTAMAARSELFCVAAPPTPHTLGLVSRAVIDALPSGALFVLVGRMVVVEQPALLARLERGELRAAIDVYSPEPPEADHVLRRLPNVVHTPHRAGNTVGANQSVFLAKCEEARRFFAGEPLRYPVRLDLARQFPPRPGVTYTASSGTDFGPVPEAARR